MYMYMYIHIHIHMYIYIYIYVYIYIERYTCTIISMARFVIACTCANMNPVLKLFVPQGGWTLKEPSLRAIQSNHH